MEKLPRLSLASALEAHAGQPASFGGDPGRPRARAGNVWAGAATR